MKRAFLLLLCGLFSQSLSAQTASRLIASTAANYNGHDFYAVDSTHNIFYNPYYGGDLTTPYISFHDATRYRFDTSLKTYLRVSKTQQEFDINNHLSASTHYIWKGGIVFWEKFNREIYSRDIQDSILSLTFQYWDLVDTSWKNLSKTEKNYNGYLAIADYAEYTWDMSRSDWNGFTKEIYDYNSKSQFYRKTGQTWDIAISNWEDFNKDSILFNSSDQPVEIQYFLWDKTGSYWRPYKKKLLAYDITSFLESEIEQGYDPGSSSWINGQRNLYTYNSGGLILDNMTQFWDATSSSWNNYQLTSYIRDVSDNIITDTRALWNKDSSKFIGTIRYLNTYNTGNNLVSSISQNWDMLLNEWQQNQLDSFAYNGYNQLTYYTYFTEWSGSKWEHRKEDQAFVYYYENHTSSKVETTQKKISGRIYPVPCRNVLYYQLEQEGEKTETRASVFDLQGKMMTCWTISAGQVLQGHIDTDKFPSGQYILQVRNDKGTLFQQQFQVIR